MFDILSFVIRGTTVYLEIRVASKNWLPQIFQALNISIGGFLMILLPLSQPNKTVRSVMVI